MTTKSEDVIARSVAGRELSIADVTALLSEQNEVSCREIYAAANELKETLCGSRVTYVVNLNLNFTNVCEQHCGFCNFRRDDNDADAYRMTIGDCLEHIGRRVSLGITEVTIQGGLDAKTPVDFYFTLVEEIKRAFPKIHIHAFSPEEIAYIHERSGEPYARIIDRLRVAGLGSMPGTAAEILVDDVRRRLCSQKVMSDKWCEIVETAHRAGLRTTSTMMYGHIETAEQRAEHLLRLLGVQRRTGGFTEFIQLPFVAEKAPIAVKRGLCSPQTREALNLVAASRLLFRDELPHIQAVAWVKRGLDEAVQSLHCGADDLGGTLIEEKITRAAGASHGSYVPAAELHRRIEAEGLKAVQRTTLYGIVEPEMIAHVGERNVVTSLAC